MHFAIHAESCHCDPPLPARVPLSLFTSLFLTGDADLVALRLLYTQRDISRHVAPVVRPDVPFVDYGIQGQTCDARRSRQDLHCYPYWLNCFSFAPVFRHSARFLRVHDGNVSWASMTAGTNGRQIIFFPLLLNERGHGTSSKRFRSLVFSFIRS